MKLKGKVMVVTGAGSGMGRELTLQLLDKDASVAMVDVRPEGMAEIISTAGGNHISTHLLNIADRESVDSLPREVILAHRTVDGVINNAGIIQPFVDVNELPYETIERIMNVNFYGTLYMIKAFLPHLLKRPEAHIANVSSMGGFIPFPGQTLYGASKAAVKLLSEGLYAELRNTRVGVTVIHPGAVDTHIMSNSGLATAAEEAESKKSQPNVAMPADEAAAMILDAIEKNKYRVMVGKDARFMDFFYRFSPQRAAHFITKKMGQMRKASR